MYPRILVFSLFIFFSVSLFAQTGSISNKKNEEKTERFMKRFEAHQHPLKFINKNHSQLKSANVEKQCMDSIYKFEYNSSMEEWVAYNKEEFIYSDDHRQLEKNNCVRVARGYPWKIENSIKVEFDASGNPLSTKTFFLNIEGQLTPQQKYETTYNLSYNISNFSMPPLSQYKIYNIEKIKNIPLVDTNYNWDIESKQWVNNTRDIYHYDTINKVLLNFTHQYYDGTEWANGYYDEYKYNSNGNIKLLSSYNWKYNSEDKYLYYTYRYYYDTEGNLTKMESSNYDMVTGEKRNGEFVYNYQYDSVNNLTDYWWNKYDEENDSLTYLEHDVFAYDSNNNLLSITHNVMYTDSTEWAVYDREVYIYDNAYTSNEVHIPFQTKFDRSSTFFKHKVIEMDYFRWDYNNNRLDELILNKKYKYYYSEKSFTSVSEMQLSEINLYPNPASNFLTIDIEQKFENASIELYSLQGCKVAHHELSGSNQINISHLKSGLYLYKIKSEGKIKRGKLQIQ